MKINKIENTIFRLPLTHYFETSFGRITHKESVLVKLYSEGAVGYGEGSSLHAPLYVPEHTEESFAVIRNFIAPLILGKDINTPEQLAALYMHIRGHEFAKTAVETAFWHLYSQKMEKSVSELLCGTKNKIEVGESLGIKETLKDLLNEVELRLSEGYKRIKIKIRPGWDIEPLRAIRKEFDSINLMVDGNSAYTLEHMDILQELDQFDLTMIEQPLGYDDIIDHAALQKRIKTPICLDESIINAEDARKAIETGACKIINIKTGRVGGLVEAKKIHDYSESKDIPVWCGGMLETCIGRFFNLSIASLPNYKYPADMSQSSIFFKEDLVERPFEIKNGMVEVPEGLEDYRVSDRLIKKYILKTETYSK